MKKTSFIIPAMALLLLSSCYEGWYAEESRMVGTLTTRPANINEENKTLSLNGEIENGRTENLCFQLSRTKDFSSEASMFISYKDCQDIPLGFLGETYYYRLCTVLNTDTVCADNIQTFTVDNRINLSTPEPLDNLSYRLVCTSDFSGTVRFQVSTDADFKDFKEYFPTSYGENEYSTTLSNLSWNTTYYVKAVREVILGTVESEVKSFSTADYLKMGEVTYTGWDGKTHPMTDGYDHFFANYAINGQVAERNLDIYRTENGWTISKNITPTGSSVLYGFYSYDKQNSDNVIDIQTYKYDNPTLMWGIAEENKGVFNINLRNMLSRVIFHLTVSDDYPVDKPEVAEFTISCSTLPTIANFQLNTGTFTYNQWSFSEPLGYWNRIGLSKGETMDLVLYSIPTSDPGHATVSMSFTDNKFNSEIETDWKSGNTYEYNLNVSATGLSISDVIVNQWQSTEGGSIIINHNK